MEGRVYVLPLGGSTRKVVFWKVSSSSHWVMGQRAAPTDEAQPPNRGAD